MPSGPSPPTLFPSFSTLFPFRPLFTLLPLLPSSPLSLSPALTPGKLRFRYPSDFGERLRGNTIRGHRTESLREENRPLKGSLRGRFFGDFQRFLAVFIVFQSFSEIFRGFQRSSQRPSQRQIFLSEILSEADFPLRDPLRGRFSSQRLSVLVPLIVLPLNLSPMI